jgi:hypothetical protein
MSSSSRTIDHDEIRTWAEQRGGRPSVVRTGKGKGGVLRLDFQEKDENFDEVSWDEFFQVFEDSGLAFLHQDKTAEGKESRFNKFVARSDEDAGAKPAKKAGAAKAATSGRASTTARKTAAAKANGRSAGADAGGSKSGSARKPAAKAAAKPAAEKKAAPAKSAAKKPTAAKATTTKPATKTASKAKG